MQLCDRDIYKAIKSGEIGFVGTNEKYPFLYAEQVQPSSIDLRLGDILVRFKESVESFDIKDKILPDEHLNVERYKDGQPIIINPWEIVFGQIYEQMWIGDKYSARVEGRSRVARLGLAIHCTGSYINPGFCGAMPLQLINYNKFPITIAVQGNNATYSGKSKSRIARRTTKAGCRPVRRTTQLCVI